VVVEVEKGNKRQLWSTPAPAGSRGNVSMSEDTLSDQGSSYSVHVMERDDWGGYPWGLRVGTWIGWNLKA